jgi:lipopolysaccharide/colanic/teichoic acid biosynthesis glycosyltransferase
MPEEARTSSSGPGLSRWHDAILRAINVLVAAFCLVVLSPVILVVAIAIKLDSHGPILYRQLRIGLDRRRQDQATSSSRRTGDLGGRPFVMYKFRTMHVNAESSTGPVWASQNDGRTTRVGRFLRRHRLDEIPQFWNVIKGDMSVVGPRPERPGFVQILRDEIDGYALRHRVPPGITGWAQVNRTPDQSVDDVRRKLEYDLEYMRRRSVWFDLRVMLRTVVVVTEPETPASSSGDGAKPAEGA